MFCYFQEKEHEMKYSELEEDMRHRDISIRTLNDEIRDLKSGVAQMSSELEAKGKEVLRIRSEANQKLK